MHKYNLEDWNYLEDFIKNNKIESYYDKIIPWVIENKCSDIIIPKEAKFFRARIIDINEKENRGNKNNGFYGYDARNSLAPEPSKVIKDGRANKKRESVLYIAEDIYTSIAEVRPGKRQNISVAQVELLEVIKVLEFKYDETPRNEEIDIIYQQIAFSFYYPVNENKKDYLITQYVCEKLRELGYDGLKYSSSLSESGSNIVIFNSKGKAKANNSKLYQVRSVLYYAENQLPREDTKKILPESITEKFSYIEIQHFFNRMKSDNVE